MPNPEMETLTIGNNTYDVRDGRIGDLADLVTTDKSTVVAAINEAAQSGGSGLTPEIKTALLQLASKVAYIDGQGAQYYQDLMLALYPLDHITAVYTQSGDVYTDDPLDILTADLVVTAYYDGGTSEVIPAADYTLSGSLSTAGTQTITVSYMGETTTFSVTVTAPLYTIPDFAEKSLTVSGKTAKVKKVDGVYTYSGNYAGAAYLYPDASTFSATKASTLWFTIPQDAVVKAQLIDMVYSNPNSASHQFDFKFSRMESGAGNSFNTAYILPANSSGTEALAEYDNAQAEERNLSSVSFQFRDTMSSACSITFKYRLWVNGVRYL